MTPESEQAGYVYVLTHPAWRNIGPVGMVKIGQTARHPSLRLKQITASSGLIAPGKVFYCVYVPDRRAAERAIHRALAEYRIRGRELFKVTPEVAAAALAASHRLSREVTLARRPRKPRFALASLFKSILACLLFAAALIIIILEVTS